MSELIKDQELSQLKKLIESKDFVASNKYLNELSLSPEVSLYYQSYLKFLQGDYAISRQLLEKSLNKGFYNDESLEAMTVVKNQLGIESLESENTFIDKTYLFSKSMPIDVIYSFVLIFSLLFCIGLGKKKIILSSLSFILAVSIGYFAYDLNQKSIFIAGEDIAVRNGPSVIFEESQYLPLGVKFIVGKEYKGWRYILYPKSHSGWMKSEKVLSL